ncbi:MAG: hypothetical protein ABI612_16020 [Betaproteobacteria bacterium]
MTSFPTLGTGCCDGRGALAAGADAPRAAAADNAADRAAAMAGADSRAPEALAVGVGAGEVVDGRDTRLPVDGAPLEV